MMQAWMTAVIVLLAVAYMARQWWPVRKPVAVGTDHLRTQQGCNSCSTCGTCGG